MRCALHVGREMQLVEGRVPSWIAAFDAERAQLRRVFRCPVEKCMRVEVQYDEAEREIQRCTSCGEGFSIRDGISLSYTKCKKCRGKATASR